MLVDWPECRHPNIPGEALSQQWLDPPRSAVLD